VTHQVRTMGWREENAILACPDLIRQALLSSEPLNYPLISAHQNGNGTSTLFPHVSLDLERFRGHAVPCVAIGHTVHRLMNRHMRSRAWGRRAKTPSKRRLAQAKAALRASRSNDVRRPNERTKGSCE
jgi:hypothetical protein